MVARFAGRGAARWPSLFYGRQKLAEDHARPDPKPRIALVQGTIDTQFGADIARIKDEAFRQYLDLSQAALAKHANIDLVVWPESMYRWIWFELREGESSRTNCRRKRSPNRSPLWPKRLSTSKCSLMLAVDRVVFTAGGPRRFQFVGSRRLRPAFAAG